MSAPMTRPPGDSGSVLWVAVAISVGVSVAVLIRSGAAPAAGVLAAHTLVLALLFAGLRRALGGRSSPAGPGRSGAPHLSARSRNRPPHDPRHLMFAGRAFFGGAVFVAVMIALGGVDSTGRVISGGLLALWFLVVGSATQIIARFRRELLTRHTAGFGS